MKRHIFFTMLLSILFSPLVFGQGGGSGAGKDETPGAEGFAGLYVGNGALVYVSPSKKVPTNGVFVSGGDIRMAPGGVFLNNGNVKASSIEAVDGAKDVLYNKDDKSFKKDVFNVDFSKKESLYQGFVNTYDKEGTYGQLILENDSEKKPNILIQKPIQDLKQISFSLPFTGVYDASGQEKTTLKDVFLAAFSNEEYEYKGDGDNYGRTNHNIVWPVKVSGSASYDMVGVGSQLNIYPGSYYVLSKDGFGPKGNTLNFLGRPNISSMNRSNFIETYPLSGFSVAPNSKSIYGHFPRSYMHDPIRKNHGTPGWAHNTFLFGNPFTSNIDVKEVFNESWDKLLAVSIISGGSEGIRNSGWVSGVANGGQILIRKSSDGSISGDLRARFIPPLTAFVVKMDDGYDGGAYDSDKRFGDDLNFKFDNTTKTFNYDEVDRSEATATRTKRSTGNLSRFDHLQLMLLSVPKTSQNDEGRVKRSLDKDFDAAEGPAFELQSTFLVARSKRDAKVLKGDTYSELYDAPATDGSFMYTEKDGKSLYLNSFGEDMYGKPLNLKMDYLASHENYKLRVVGIDSEGSSSAPYYLVDKKENKAQRLENGSEFSITAADIKSKRYELYYGEYKKDLLKNNEGPIANSDINAKSTYVYESRGFGHFVRFVHSPSKTKASVDVYDISSGTKIASYNQVDTKTDLGISDLRKGNYIFKVTYADGTRVDLKVQKGDFK